MKQIKLRVVSISEEKPTLFAFYLLASLEREQGRKINPISITQYRFIAEMDFIPVYDWNWEKAITNIQYLSKQGKNTIILSDRFLEWQTQNEYINDDLRVFETEIRSSGLNVINVESYLIGDTREKQKQFKDIKSWGRIHIKEVIKIMQTDYIDQALVLPYGVLPYFQLKPDESIEDRYNPVHAFIGFQPWSHDALSLSLEQDEYPFIHNVGMLKGEPVAPYGPVPFIVSID